MIQRGPSGLSGILKVDDLRVAFDTPRGVVEAVNGVSFQLNAGATLGIVGESGAGKSVLTRSVMNLLPRGGVHRTGTVVFDGQDIFAMPPKQWRHILGKDIALVPQHPASSLNPVLTVGDQIEESLRIHLGVVGRRARDRAAELLASVGIAEPQRRLGDYPHQMSGGMCQRVMIAIALSCEPKLLIADEATTALDVTIQAQVLDLLLLKQAEQQMALIIVTHDLNIATSCTDRVAVMYGGSIVELAPSSLIASDYRMRYTEALMTAVPSLDRTPKSRLKVIPGQPPDPVRLPHGCRFHPRCPHASDRCRDEVPPLVSEDQGEHAFACWHPAMSTSLVGARN